MGQQPSESQRCPRLAMNTVLDLAEALISQGAETVPAPRKYDEEIPLRAVRMYQERIGDLGKSKLTVRRAVGRCWTSGHAGQPPVQVEST